MNTLFHSKILPGLKRLYGETKGKETALKLEKIAFKYFQKNLQVEEGWDEKDVWLITYGDSIQVPGKPSLRVLHDFLRRHTDDLFSFIHILPFLPYSSDDGFSVKDYRKVRPSLGTWEDLAPLGENYRLIFDAVINHTSASGTYMKRFLSGDCDMKDFFIEVDPAIDFSKVVRPRALPLVHSYESVSGPLHLWTTFSDDQVDLNYANPEVLLEVMDILLFYLEKGASGVRLDAVAYLWKEVGTSCIHLDGTHKIVKLIRTLFEAVCPGAVVLTETNVPHQENISYLGSGQDEAHIIYNFSLSPLILHSILSQNASALTKWASNFKAPKGNCTLLNFTASHDGIGLRPTEGLLTTPEINNLVETTISHKGKVSYKANEEPTKTPYELNINYFDALNDPSTTEPIEKQVDRFLVSQAIMLSFAGIPAVYIHSLLGSRNDYNGMERTGRARSINREKLNAVSIEKELSDPKALRHLVFERYKKLLRARRSTKAFHPNSDQEIYDIHPSVFAIKRRHQESGEEIICLHNVSGTKVDIRLPEHPGDFFSDILSPNRSFSSDIIKMFPYEFLWLKQ